jgi:broad specificity phosphatase PhoE
MTTILLVRHGRTAWNREERFRGQIDLPLDDWGLQQADLVGQRIASQWQPEAIYASSLQRTLQTAAGIARACNLHTTIHDGFLDIDYGAFAGLTSDEAASQYPDLARAWQRAPHMVLFPEGESLAEVRERAEAALKEIAANHPDQTVVLVTHVVVCRLLLCALLGLANSYFWGFQPDTASITVFEFSDHRRVLLSFGDTCHLMTPSGGKRAEAY